MLGRSLIACLLAAAVAVPAATADRVRSSGSVYGSAAVNRALAHAQASRLLAELSPPPGATQPARDGHLLSRPADDEATPNLVDARGFWTTSQPPAAVLAYVAARLPPGTRRDLSGGFGGGGSGPQVQSRYWGLTPTRGLAERIVGASVVALAHHMTAVRLDGEAVWLTPRPAWERIPSGVSAVIVTGHGQTDRGAPAPTSAARTVSGARATRLAAFVNALPAAQPGVSACAAALNESVTLRFIGRGGRALARAVESPTGCGSVALRIGARQGPGLEDAPSPFDQTGVTDELLRLHIIRTCAVDRLTVTAATEPPGPPGPQITFRLRNDTRAICALRGFPRVSLRGAGGRPIPTRARDDGRAVIRRLGLSATAVIFPTESATFTASYRTCDAPGATAARIGLPGVSGQVSVALRSIRPCGGRLALTSLAPSP